MFGYDSCPLSHHSSRVSALPEEQTTFLRDRPRHKRASVADRHKWHRLSLSTGNVAVARFAHTAYGITSFFNKILLTSLDYIKDHN